MESPFDVLGVDADADEATIDRAYRDRVLATHPDQGGDREDFQLVIAAYEAISTGEWADDDEERPADGDGWRDPDRWRVGPDRRQHDGAWVEFLDYEVLADHGWSLDDDGLFEAAAAADLDESDHGRLYVRPHESLLEAVEHNGFTWPYACRGGACANCAVAMVDGDLEMPANHVLPDEMMDRSIRLSCNGMPSQGELQVVFNLKHRPDLDDLRLPPHRFERDQAAD